MEKLMVIVLSFNGIAAVGTEASETGKSCLAGVNSRVIGNQAITVKDNGS